MGLRGGKKSKRGNAARGVCRLSDQQCVGPFWTADKWRCGTQHHNQVLEDRSGAAASMGP